MAEDPMTAAVCWSSKGFGCPHQPVTLLSASQKYRRRYTTYFAQGGCLFKNSNRVALSAKSDCSGQTAKASTDDDHVKTRWRDRS
jgi:hypothetical protein